MTLHQQSDDEQDVSTDNEHCYKSRAIPGPTLNRDPMVTEVTGQGLQEELMYSTGVSGQNDDGDRKCKSWFKTHCSVDELYKLDSESFIGFRDPELSKLCGCLRSVEMTENCDLVCEGRNNLLFEEGFDEELDSAKVYTADRDGDNFLHLSILSRNECLIQTCISMAATPSWLAFANNLFQTPLHLAVLTHQLSVVKSLITSGAELTSRDFKGNTPLHIACRDGLVGIAKEILKTIVSDYDQHVFNKNFRISPSDLSILNYEGNSCLHLAATGGHLDIVELLIKNNVDLNVKEGKAGRTILHNACSRGDINLVRMLLKEKSCDINAKAYDGLTPFDIGRFRNQEEVCMALAAAGARYGDDDDDSE